MKKVRHLPQFIKCRSMCCLWNVCIILQYLKWYAIAELKHLKQFQNSNTGISFYKCIVDNNS